MARIFKQQYTRAGVTKESRKWYIEYVDADGKRVRVPGYTDKAATQQKAGELERQAAQQQSGLIDKYAEHRKRPLAEHLKDFEFEL